MLIVEADSGKIAVEAELLASVAHAAEDVLILTPGSGREGEGGEERTAVEE